MFRISKLSLLVVMIVMAMTLSAQDAVKVPKFTDNWSVGFDFGVASPVKGGDFIGNFRPAIGLNLEKQLTPALAFGVESSWSINSSRWHQRLHSTTAFDDSYIGLYGSVDFIRLSTPFSKSPFSVGLSTGCGWGHSYYTNAVPDNNFFAAKVGLAVNYKFSKAFSFGIKPSFIWNLSDAGISQTSAGFNGNKAIFSLQAGLRYSFGPGFEFVRTYDGSQLDTLNGQVNKMRCRAGGCCRGDIIREDLIDNQMNTVLDVFFHAGSSEIASDQVRNVELIADYLNNNPELTVDVKGYTSREGNKESNLRLAQHRADAVRDMLINVYKISSERITAQGIGVGDIFEEDSWNRVSVCTLEIK